MKSSAAAYLSGDKSLYMRFANVWSRVLEKNDVLFTICEQVGIVDEIVALCRGSNDILVQTVALELLPFFGRTARGTRCLLDQGTANWLVQLSGTVEGQGDPFIGAQALRILSEVFCHPKLRHKGSHGSSSGIATTVGHLDNSNNLFSSFSGATFEELWGLADGSSLSFFQSYLKAIYVRLDSRDEAERLAGEFSQ
jgi:hypothetical protein